MPAKWRRVQSRASQWYLCWFSSCLMILASSSPSKQPAAAQEETSSRDLAVFLALRIQRIPMIDISLFRYQRGTNCVYTEAKKMTKSHHRMLQIIVSSSCCCHVPNHFSQLYWPLGTWCECVKSTCVIRAFLLEAWGRGVLEQNVPIFC